MSFRLFSYLPNKTTGNLVRYYGKASQYVTSPYGVDEMDDRNLIACAQQGNRQAFSGKENKMISINKIARIAGIMVKT